jgi:hypothetical protein
MSELVRNLVSKVRGYVVERRFAPRVRIRLPFSISVRTSIINHQPIKFIGNTQDISANGVALLFHCIRFDTYYLLKDSLPLNLVLELPSGPVSMVIQPVRYERLGTSDADCAHLIGAQIVTMNEEDREKFLAYILPRVRVKLAAI